MSGPGWPWRRPAPNSYENRSRRCWGTLTGSFRWRASIESESASQGPIGSVHVQPQVVPCHVLQRIHCARVDGALYSADEKTALELLWLAPLKPGEAYGRQPRGSESFGPQPGP